MSIQYYNAPINRKGLYSDIDSICEIRLEEFYLEQDSLLQIIVSPDGFRAAIEDGTRKKILLISLPQKQLIEKISCSKYKYSATQMIFSLDSQYLIMQYSNFIVINHQGCLVKLKPFGKNLEVVHIITDNYNHLYVGTINPYSQQKPIIYIYDLKECVQLKQIRFNIFDIEEIQETFSFQNVSKNCVIGHIEDSLFFLTNCQTGKYLKIYPCPFNYQYHHWGVRFLSPFACVKSDKQIKILQLYKWKQIRKVMIATGHLDFKAFLLKNDLILIIIDDDTDEEKIKTQEIHCMKFHIFTYINTFMNQEATAIQSNPKILVKTEDEKFQIIKYK